MPSAASRDSPLATGLPRYSRVPDNDGGIVYKQILSDGRERLATVASTGYAGGACSLLALASPRYVGPLLCGSCRYSHSSAPFFHS